MEESTDTTQLEENVDYTILPLIIWPDDKLKLTAKDVTDSEFGTPELDRTIIDLTATMKYYKSSGIAANQVNVDKKIIIMEFYPNEYFVLINPRITSYGDKKLKIEEGCISVPGIFDKRSRPGSCVVEYQEIDGTKVTKEFTGAYAFGVQHNVSLLYGKCFADDANIIKKQHWKNVMKKFKEKHKELKTSNII